MVLHAGWPASPQLLEAPPFPKLGVRTKGPTLYPSFVLLLDATLPAHTRAADSPAGRSEALELLRGTGAQPTTKLHYETANWARRTCVSPLSGLSAAYVCCHLPAAAAPPRLQNMTEAIHIGPKISRRSAPGFHQKQSKRPQIFRRGPPHFPTIQAVGNIASTGPCSPQHFTMVYHVCFVFG